ncbi:hypothetical protein E4A47_10295 [Micrococcus flavus]|uniref:Murein DD-endopeptidase MepM/ murein hydrolase activator NlpD n=1 Tax=Micrococcus flavus TaxID=384602 RepID=A0A4Y8WWA7_9MICC|nr:transglycosylase SLT domain-containing protein [Micrococcus flavus]MBB4883956.1 murein DD-endopeptidase MepM/ murein hydrolase activator NlpD [Micrococcus flavus]TFH99367.1 hypothetical protein E4A47_10295 [Micrococcus flavus]GGK54375.1 peptidase [Micrococcus flavus]
MDDSKGKVAVAALLLLLFIMLLPLFLLTTAAQEEYDQRATSLAGCMLGADGQVEVPEQYVPHIEKAATVANMPAAVIAAQIWTESRFNPQAVSKSGARGIAQFMPDTWDTYGNGADPFDPIAGIDAQGRYMRDLQKMVAPLVTSDRSRIELALAAYNAGPAAVIAAGGMPAKPETQAYVPQIMRLAQVDFTTGCQDPGGEVIGELGTGKWVNPLPNSYVTSPFGRRSCPPAPAECTGSARNHSGLDLGTSSRAGTVVANADMKIIKVNKNEDAGYEVVGQSLDNPNVRFAFFHCATGSHRVTVGQTVTPGTPLCTEGMNGNASAPHLHFMVIINGTPVDPEPILLAKKVPLRYT